MSIRERTSTPWVGSSASSTRGSPASTRPSATFCWLPPESEVGGASAEPMRMPKVLTVLLTRSRSACQPITPQRLSLSSMPTVRFSRIGSERNSDSSARSPER